VFTPRAGIAVAPAQGAWLLIAVLTALGVPQLYLNRTVQRTVTVEIFRLGYRAALVRSKRGPGFPAGSAQIGVINSSFGPLVAGLLVGSFGGSFNRVTAFMTCFALLTTIAILLGCETMGDPLPR
jgi:hypothetical protein